MTYGHILPELEAHHRVERRPHKRQKVSIPTMSNRWTPSPYDDETVIGVILASLNGEKLEPLSERAGISRGTVKGWIYGLNRSKCYREALKRHHRAHGVKRYG